MFKLVPVLFPPPLRQAWTITEPPRSPGPSDREELGEHLQIPDVWWRGARLFLRGEGAMEAARRRGERRIPTPFFGLFDSNSRLNSLMCFCALSTTLALPHFRYSPIWRPVSVYLSVRLQRHTCQGAGLPEGVHSGGRLVMWKVFKTLLKCSFRINDGNCTGGLKTCQIRPAGLAGKPGVEAVLFKIIQLLITCCGFVSSEIIIKGAGFYFQQENTKLLLVKIYHISFFNSLIVMVENLKQNTKAFY